MELQYAKDWSLNNIDNSKWVHPTSNYLEQMNNNPRGRMFEDYVAKMMTDTFPHLSYVNARDTGGELSDGQPDVTFSFDLNNRNKYIEVKSVLEKESQKNKHYEITRLKVYDDGEYGNPNFDYLVVCYIHPSKGVIYRSMTHQECVRGIRLDILKYRKEWKGYSFKINCLQEFKHTSLEMYDNLDVIKEYEKTEPDFLNSALDSDDTNSMMEGQLTFNF